LIGGLGFKANLDRNSILSEKQTKSKRTEGIAQVNSACEALSSIPSMPKMRNMTKLGVLGRKQKLSLNNWLNQTPLRYYVPASENKNKEIRSF
jgi:hypothetical protein